MSSGLVEFSHTMQDVTQSKEPLAQLFVQRILGPALRYT